jgi:hypothetical protein
MAEPKADFITHLNYVTCLRELSDGLTVKYQLKSIGSIKLNKLLTNKHTLIKLIKRSFDVEFAEICKNHDFAEVCVPWIAVKSYYLLFNTCLIIGHLLNTNDSYFKSSHEKVLRDIKTQLRSKKLKFNRRILNKVYNAWDVFKFSFPSGYNIKLISANTKTRYKQLLKKLVIYKIEDFQRREKINNWRTKKARDKRNRYLKSSDINVCDFFYWYRIKANYRDLEFLDKEITCEQFYDFYDNYYRLTMNFYDAFKNLINDLMSDSLGQKRFIDF